MNRNTLDKTELDLRTAVRREICVIIDDMCAKGLNRLPPEIELASTLHVSRVTIRSVLAELANEGKVLRRQGSGTYINPTGTGSKASLYPMLYYWNIIHNYGYKPSIRLIESTVISGRGEAGKHLGLPPESRLICLKRAFCADGQVCIYCVDAFDSALVKGRSINADKECSIFQLLYEVSGCIITWADTRIFATDTRRVPELAPLMNHIPYISKPLLLFKNICYDKKDSPMLYAESYFDTDLIEFSYVQQYGSGRTTDDTVE